MFLRPRSSSPRVACGPTGSQSNPSRSSGGFVFSNATVLLWRGAMHHHGRALGSLRSAPTKVIGFVFSTCPRSSLGPAYSGLGFVFASPARLQHWPVYGFVAQTRVFRKKRFFFTCCQILRKHALGFVAKRRSLPAALPLGSFFHARPTEASRFWLRFYKIARSAELASLRRPARSAKTAWKLSRKFAVGFIARRVVAAVRHPIGPVFLQEPPDHRTGFVAQTVSFAKTRFAKNAFSSPVPLGFATKRRHATLLSRTRQPIPKLLLTSAAIRSAVTGASKIPLR